MRAAKLTTHPHIEYYSDNNWTTVTDILNYCAFNLIIYLIQHKIICTKQMTYLALFPWKLDFVLIVLNMSFECQNVMVMFSIFMATYLYTVLMCGCTDISLWKWSTEGKHSIVFIVDLKHYNSNWIYHFNFQL